MLSDRQERAGHGWGAADHATRWRADARRGTPEACWRASLPSNAQRWLLVKLALAISRPGAGRRVSAAKVGAHLAGLWEPRIPAVRAFDLVLEPARLPPGTRSPSSLPSAVGFGDPVLRPIHQDVRLPIGLPLPHLFGPKTRPRAGLVIRPCREAREQSQEALGNSSSAAACLLSSFPSGRLAWTHQDARQAGSGERVSE